MSQYCETEDEKQSNNKRRKEPFQIKTDALLLVEGKDEYQTFQALLKEMNINGVQIYDVEGNNNFANKIPRLFKSSGFQQISKLGFVRDAEQHEAKSAFDSICHVLECSNIFDHVPRNIGKVEEIGSFKVGIFIMPNNKDKGMLETLCLQSIKDMHCLL